MSSGVEPDEPITVYYSFHRRDRNLLDKLDMHLSGLKRQGYISTWHIGLVEAKEQEERENAYHWEQAQIILLLISPEYLADDHCYRQMELAVARAEQTLSQVIPVLVSAAHLEHTPLHQFQPLPKGGRPISRWRQRDVALAEVADGVRSVVASFIARQYTTALPESARTVALPSRKILSDPLPPHNHHSILRRDHAVQEIYSRLIQPDTSTIVLTGLAGIGKSTVAAQVYDYAEQLRRSGEGPFNSEALWLRIRPHLTLRTLATKIAIAQEQWPGNLASLFPEELALQLFRFLKASNTQRLIVLDGFEQWVDGQAGKVRPQYAGVGEWLDILNSAPCSCRILITTRMLPQGNYHHRHIYIKEYPLRGLEDKEVEELLRLWDIQADQKELKRIFTLSNGHPLALVFLDKLLHNRHIRLATLLNDAAYKQLWVNDLGVHLLNHIYDQLDTFQRGLLAAFAIYREAVPWRAAYSVLRSQQEMTEEQFQSASGVLLSLNLLQRHTASGEERYELHPIVAEFIREYCNKSSQLPENLNKEKAHAEAARYYRYSCLSRPTERQPSVDDVHLWIEAVWHHCQAEQWQEGYELLQRGNLFALLGSLGEYIVLRELYTLFLISGKWHPEAGVAASMYNELGEIYQKLGEKGEAKVCFEKALEYSNATLNHASKMKALNNLGSIYRSYEQIEKALACYQDAMLLCEKTPESVEQGITLNNVGRALQDLGQGEPTLKKSEKYYHNAITYYKKALALYKGIHSEVETARTTNNLGEVCSLLGKTSNAYSCYQQSLTLFRKLGERRDEGVVCSNLGTFYRKKEQYLDAFEYYLQAFHIFQQIGTRLDEAIVLRNLGHVYIMMQRNDAALVCFLLARDIYEEMHLPHQGSIGRGLQALLSGERPFEQTVAAIGQNAKRILEESIAQHLQAT